VVSRTWRKVRSDVERARPGWGGRGCLVLDRIVVRLRLDRNGIFISLLLVLGRTPA